MIVLVLAAGVLALAVMLAREQHRLRREKAGLLASVLPLLREARHGTGADGFPWVKGIWQGRRVVLRVVPDLSILRRLPQLWLVIHLPEADERSCLVVTARPRGEEFISAGAALPFMAEVPDWLPQDLAMRSDGVMAPAEVEPLRTALSALFKDARLKEVSVLKSGSRLVYQLAEGDRGSHLIGRQARFKVAVAPQTIMQLLDHLGHLQAQMPKLSHEG